jgi:oxygen-independent coproporphyrinogen III oxidase
VLSDDDRHRADVIRALMTSGRAPLTPQDAAMARTELVDLVRDGLLEIDDRELRITPNGKPFIRNVAAFFDTYLRHAAKEGPIYSRAI